jgi:hypothetical protein
MTTLASDERTVDLIVKHLKASGITVDQENRKLSMTGMCEAREFLSFRPLACSAGPLAQFFAE